MDNEQRKKDYRSAWKRWEFERRRKPRPDAGPVAKWDVVTTVGDALTKWSSTPKVRSQIDGAEVVERFAEIVGSVIAAQAIPVRLERGKLIVRVPDSSWRHQLLFMRRELIGKINDFVGRRVVSELVLTA